METRVVIHPNEGGPTHADSPYTKKLKRLREDLQMLLTVAPADDAPEILIMVSAIDQLLSK